MDMHSGLLPGQFRRIDATPEKPGRALQVGKRVRDAGFHSSMFVGVELASRLLGLGPNVLVGIELRSISGKVVQMKSSAATEIQTHGFVPMDLGAVPQEDDFASKVAQQQTKNSTTRSPLMFSRWHRRYMPIHWVVSVKFRTFGDRQGRRKVLSLGLC